MTITEHVAAVTPLVHGISPRGADERSLLRWSINVTMAVLGVPRAGAVDFVRRATNR